MSVKGGKPIYRRTITVRGESEKEVRAFIVGLLERFEYSLNWQGDVVLDMEDIRPPCPHCLDRPGFNGLGGRCVQCTEKIQSEKK